MNKKSFILIIIAIILILLLIAYGWHRRSGSSDRIEVSGNIEVTEVPLGFKSPGRVLQRLVDEGDRVSTDQKIAILDSRELQDEVAAREAEVAAAEAALAELVTGYLPEEIAQAEAKVKEARAEWVKQKDEQARQKKLFDTAVISAREYEASVASYKAAHARYQESVEYLKLLRSGTRVEKIDQSRANVDQAKQRLAVAKTRLNDTTLLSPISGYVLSKNVEAGEVVSAGTPVVTLGNLNDVWLRAYIMESDLGRVRLGQKVDVTNDSYPDKVYHGTITFISQEAEFTPKNIQTQKERVKLVYRIKVTLENPNQELKPGMPADGVILIENN